MNSAIDLQNDAGFDLDETRLRAAVSAVLRQCDAPAGSSLSLVIGDDAQMAALNKQFRGIDSATDVLSFPSGVILNGDPAPYLGDIIIAYPYAAAQAEAAGHDRMHSLMLLAIHGTLHLLGFDHDTPEHQRAMWAAQDQALESLSLPLSLVPSFDHG